uniref:Uncharacterized protein n=1 Tax=Pseudomonas syringae pv. actinidiae TaxID=103796 RepID=A0A2P0QFI7_PSESF|nr:hypothetical protein [Pseudomonas syringae pv. actinidiae]
MATVPVAIDPAAAVPDPKGEGFRLCPPCQATDPAAAVPDPKGEGFRLWRPCRWPSIQLQPCPTQTGKDSGYQNS